MLMSMSPVDFYPAENRAGFLVVSFFFSSEISMRNSFEYINLSMGDREKINDSLIKFSISNDTPSRHCLKCVKA